MNQIRLSLLAFIFSIAFYSASAQTWTTLGTGVGAQVNAMTIFNNELYAAGMFTTAGGNPANRVAKWTGTAWAALGTGTAFPANALAVYNNELYAGYYLNTIYKWNGTAWTTLAPGGSVQVLALAVYNSELYVGAAGQILKYNGTTWSAPITVSGGTSTTGPNVSAFAVYNGELYAAGNFATINGVSANNIAKWNGTAWSAVGTGISGTVAIKLSALTVYNNELYVGGVFTTAGGLAVSNLAKWNGTTSAWSVVGSGVNGPVLALHDFSGKLFIGGSFQFASPWNTQNMTMWDGTAFLPFGPGTDNQVRALATFNSQLIAGGDFLNAGVTPANYIAQYNQCTTAPPPPTAMSGKDTTCTGGNQTYSTPLIVGMSYNWTLPSGWTGTSTSNSINATPVTGTGSVTVSTINACGSSTAITKTVLVNPAPNATVTASGPLTFCQGGSVTLTTPNVTGSTYQWRNGPAPIAGASSNTYVATTPGTYTVRVINSACTTISSVNTVVVHPLPSIPVVTVTGNTLSTATGMAGYQWYLNGSQVSGATSANHTATVSGNYYVIITDGNGCTAQSATHPVTVVGINDLSASSGIQLFPNPHNGIFTIKYPASKLNGKIAIEVRDISGKLVYSEGIAATGSMIEKTVNLVHLPAGAYSVRIISDNNSTVHSLIKK